jgi:hypothetical protein
VARDAHDGLLAGPGLGKLRNGVVAHIVEPQAVQRASQGFDVCPARLVLTGGAWLLNRSTGGTGNRTG